MDHLYTSEELDAIANHAPIQQVMPVSIEDKVQRQRAYLESKELLEEMGFELDKEVFYVEVVNKKRQYLGL